MGCVYKNVSIVLLAGIFGLSGYLFFRKRKVKLNYDGQTLCLNFPPCVPSIPILGSIPFLPPFPVMYKFFTKKSNKYPDVAAYYVMNKYRIVLNSREAIHEAFVKRSNDFSSRPPGVMNNVFNADRKGIIFHPYNEHFKKYHKMSLGIMKQFGFGNRIMEKRIMEEVLPLLETLTTFQGKEICPRLMATKCSMNIICGVLFGKRFEDNDPELTSIMENIKASFANLPKVFILSLIPFLKYFSYFKNALSNSVEAQEKVFAMLEDKIIECTDDSNGLESFIRSYIEAEGPQYDKDQLLHFMHEMFLVGTETTASTLEWSLVLLGNHREVQEKMFSEMEKIEDRLPSLDDKKDLPYCEAVLCEILRMKPAVPQTLPHITMRDTHVMGYYIPDKTFVFANVNSVHHNVKTWGDPGNFRPERFIDERGLLNAAVRDKLVTFSLGKRSCFGEILAKQEVFLTLTNLVKRFVILPPVDQKEILVDDVMDVTSKPSPFRVRIVERATL